MSLEKATPSARRNKAEPSSSRTVLRNFSKETLRQRCSRAKQIDRQLSKIYPDARCTLNFKTPLELLMATILAAQCTDERVNIVTRALFRKYRTVKAYAQAEPEVFQRDIASVGFFRNKTRSVLGCGRVLLERYDSQVPQTMEHL